MDVDLHIIILLLLVGLFVGVVNTFAGAAAAVSISLFTALGMDVNTANGTNRLPVLMQTVVMSAGFRKQGYLDVRTGLKLGVPTTLGAIVGSVFAVNVPPTVFQILLATMLIILLLLLLFNPNRFLNPRVSEVRRLRWDSYLWFLLIGLYGGFFHIGVGYFILTASILSLGYNLMEANALKGFIVMLYIPFTLAIFMMEGKVVYNYGLIHGCGNIVGTWFATRNAGRIPMNFIRWLLVVMIIVTVLDLFKIISLGKALEGMFGSLLN